MAQLPGRGKDEGRMPAESVKRRRLAQPLSHWKGAMKSRRAALFVATCAFTGYFPLLPGTVGSGVGLLLDRGLRLAGSSLLHGLVLLAICLAGLATAGVAETHFGRKDPSPVVVDEVAGMLLSLYLVPVGWRGAILGFLLFRLLDIAKPFPCRRAERLPGGAGIMADDLLAGLYVNGLLRVAALWWPALFEAAV